MRRSQVLSTMFYFAFKRKRESERERWRVTEGERDSVGWNECEKMEE